MLRTLGIVGDIRDVRVVQSGTCARCGDRFCLIGFVQHLKIPFVYVANDDLEFGSGMRESRLKREFCCRLFLPNAYFMDIE